jgi:hypothetical protein
VQTPTLLPTQEDIRLGPFAVVGITPGNHLIMYDQPAEEAVVINQIPGFEVNLSSLGDIIPGNNTNWIQLTYQGEEGWVDYSYLAEQHGDPSDDLIKLGQQVLLILKTKQYQDLMEYIHPGWCLRFSPYQYLTENDQVICPTDFEQVISSKKTYTWGAYDGTGDPIILTFHDYQTRFIYDSDYFQPPIVGFGVEVSSGNAINNISDIYPDGMMVEYYFPGFDPQYGGMDWRSLRLVFVRDNNTWYLAAIVHGEWTI